MVVVVELAGTAAGWVVMVVLLVVSGFLLFTVVQALKDRRAMDIRPRRIRFFI